MSILADHRERSHTRTYAYTRAHAHAHTRMHAHTHFDVGRVSVCARACAHIASVAGKYFARRGIRLRIGV